MMVKNKNQKGIRLHTKLKLIGNIKTHKNWSIYRLFTLLFYSITIYK